MPYRRRGVRPVAGVPSVLSTWAYNPCVGREAVHRPARETERQAMDIEGRCHCRNIAFELEWNPEPAQIPARACDCSFCVKHGGVWTSNPDGRLRVTVADDALVSRYAFGTQTAVFHVCRRCGVVPLVTSEIEGNVYAVVSVNAFDNVDPSMLSRAPASFDGESTASRLTRRRQGWIPDVRFLGGGDAATGS